jgi:hypothetical protein
MATCNICVEKLNKSNHAEIICSYCDFSHCKQCFQKYLLETTQPICMNCKKVFTQDFLFEKCTSTFLSKELKKHRETTLLNYQKSYLPATQQYVIIEKERDQLREQMRQLEIEKQELLLKFNKKQSEINMLVHRINHPTLGAVYNNGNQTFLVEAEKERRKFIRKCPMEDCRGFLSQQWKCGVCDSKICNKCNEEKLDTECNAEGVHQCKPDNVASMELLNKDTKPCPECGTMIFKISGCSQMFCVDCHCAWNWNTGLVEKGIVHNPHYYEFLRKGGVVGGRNHGDIPCGGLPHLNEIRTFLQEMLNCGVINNFVSSLFYSIHNVITHIQHHELRGQLAVDPLSEENTRKLRVEYMMNKITEDFFMKSLQQLEKSVNKKRDFNNIYQMFVDVSSDVFRQMLVYRRSIQVKSELKPLMKKHVDEQLVVLENLRKYFNENVKKCGKGYKCVYPGISDNFNFQTNYATYIERVLYEEERQRQRDIQATQRLLGN